MSRNPFPADSAIVTYARDSGGDEQERSVDQQQAEYAAWARIHELVIVAQFSDRARPGSTIVGRDGFEAMMAFMHSHGPLSDNPVRGLLLWKHNRFARNLDESQFFKADLRRRGFLLHFLADDIPDAGTATPIFETLLEWKAAQDLRDISSDAKRGLLALVSMRREDGTPEGFAPGRPPTCFTRQVVQIGVKRNGQPRLVSRWVPDTASWDRGRQAWAMRAAGASLSAIHDATRLFKSKSNYHAFFANEIYRGVFVFGGSRIENFVPALATQDQWDIVQAMRAKEDANRKERWHPDRHPRQAYSRHLLSGLCTCTRCGSNLIGNSVAGWRHYICRRKKEKACDLPRIGADRFEAAVIGDVSQHVLSAEALSVMLTHAVEALKESKGKHTHEISATRREISDTQAAIKRLLRLAEASDDALDSVKDRLRELEAQKRVLERQLVVLQANLRNLKLPEEPELREFAARLKQGLLSGDPHLSKPILRALIAKIEVNDGGAVIHYTFPLQRSRADGDITMDIGGAPMGAILISIVRPITWRTNARPTPASPAA
ncbi:MAG TPA: recombinase family protein [Accumulibacter sp.]|uniref:recombinase family protein n=1 Tax=Accumulibacter sp. TaxID=2053492 RepID=UPI002BA22B5F|nr:recombinase family protein [Accumulibacter sp.]HRF71763.1 recombinase family protein [Accumulibacter sp.]